MIHPLARTSRLAQFFHLRIRRDSCERLLGALQRGGLRRDRLASFTCCDLKQVEKYKCMPHDWPAFAKLLRRLLGDAIRLWRLRGELPAETYASRRADQRLEALIETAGRNGESRRLIKRLRRHQAESFNVSRSRWSPVRQQPRGARGASGSDHPQEQLRQPERSLCRCAGGVDDHIPHAQTTRSPTDANDRSSLENLRPHRTIAATPSIATSDG